MMSTPSSSPAAQLGNVTPQRLDTNQQTRPLPWYFGRRWFAVTWCVSQIYNFTTTTRSSGGKGGKGGTPTTQASCDVAGLVACKRTDWLEAIEVDGAIAWTAGISRDGSHVEHTGDIVVPGIGTFRLHWGTETAAGDWLILASGGEDHPFYRGVPVLECKSLNCGSSGSLPNIRVLLETAPVFGSLDGNRTREGANPVTGLAELIEDDFAGAGQAGVVEATSAGVLADALAARERTIAIPGDPAHVAKMDYQSAYIEERQTIGAFLTAVLEGFDGWVRRTGEQLEFGQFAHGIVDTSGLLELTLHDLIETPELPSPAPDDPSVITDAIVTGPDRDWNMQDSWQPGSNDVARDRLGETRTSSFERRFFCTSYQQKEQAQELARFYSVPAKEVPFQFRRSKVGATKAGDRIIFNWSPSSSRIVYRVTKRRDPARGGAVELTLIRERGIGPLHFVAPADNAPALPDPPVPGAVVHARVFALPIDSIDGQLQPYVTILVERPTNASGGFRVHYSADGTTYDLLESSIGWALRGSLAGNLTTGTTTFTVNAAGRDLALLAAQTAAAQADDTLLLVVGTEIMSIGAASALGGGQYSATVLRGRRGTVATTHATSDEIYIARRSDLLILSHEDFPRSGGTRYFKLQTFNDAQDEDLSGASPIAFAFADTRPAVPTGLTPIAYAGYNALDCADTALAATYLFWRNTTNTSSTATLIGDNVAAWFDDAAVSPGTIYWYFVSIRDRSGLESAKSSGVSVVTAAAPIGDVTPGNPTAATKTGQGVRLGLDGSVFAYFEISVPALPTGAKWQNLLARVNISGDFAIAAQLANSSAATVRIEGLVPGQAYQVATQAWAPGRPSSVVAATGAPFTAPGDTTAPPAPASFSFIAGDDASVRPPPITPGGVLSYACTMRFTPSTATDVRLYQYILSPTGSQVGATVALDAGAGVQISGTVAECPIYSTSNTGPLYVMMRAIDWSGNVTATLAQSADMSGYLKKPAGNLVEQNKSAVDISGGKAVLGGLEANVTAAVDVRAVNARGFDSGGTQTWRHDNVTGNLFNNGNQVLGARVTGWGTAPTDGARHALTAASTQAEHNEAIRQLIADLHQSAGHGAIGT